LRLALTFRGIRKRLGKTQVEFAQLIGCRQNTLSQYEAGKIAPSRSVLLLLLRLAQGNERRPILDALGVDDDLQDGWTAGELESILEEFQEYLNAGGKGVRIPEPAKYRGELVRAVMELLRSQNPVDPSIVEVIRKWTRFGGIPQAREYFEHAAIYLEVELKRFNAGEKAPSRPGASKVPPKRKGEK
jgi:transcriptional regulator with XRE-family HTH domain